jgi:hypothetical protein
MGGISAGLGRLGSTRVSVQASVVAECTAEAERRRDSSTGQGVIDLAHERSEVTETGCFGKRTDVSVNT